MTNVQWLPQAGNPIDLDDNDQEVIIRRARELKGNWGVRFVRLSHSNDAPEPKWAYLFNCGPATDGMPVITITRTTSDYTVISWDILQFLAEGDFSQCRTGRISDALDAVEDMASAVVGVQQPSYEFNNLQPREDACANDDMRATHTPE